MIQVAKYNRETGYRDLRQSIIPIIPTNETVLDYAEEVQNKLLRKGKIAEVLFSQNGYRGKGFGERIRMAWTDYEAHTILLIGEKEKSSSTVSVKKDGGKPRVKSLAKL